MIDEYLSKAESIASSISMSVPDIFLGRDAATIQSVIDQYMKVEGVGYVLVHDMHGNIIAHTFSPVIPEEIKQHAGEFVLHEDEDGLSTSMNIGNDSYLDVSQPILMGRGGYLHIGMDMSAIDSKITSALLRIQGFNLGLFVLCIIAVYYFIKHISRPLARLTRDAHRLRRQDLDFEIQVNSNDEVGDLARTMEGMRRELAGYVDKLKKSVESATEELHQTLIYLNTIMDNMADGLVVLDERGRIIRYNASFKRIFSITKSNLIEVKASLFIGRDVVGYYLNRASQEYQRMEFKFKHPDGSLSYIEASISMISMTCGISYIVIFHDITSRKDMEEELKNLYSSLEIKVRERTEELEEVNKNLNAEVGLRKSAELQLQSEKEFFAVTLKSIGDAVLTTDKHGRLVFINRVGEELLGIESEAGQGSYFRDVFTLKDNMARLLDPFEKVISSKRIYEKSRGVVLLSKTGREYQISFKIAPIYDRQSQILGTVMVFQDISDFLYLEEERLRKEKLESIGLLAGGIAHDFNNILTAILNHIILVKSSLNSNDPNLAKMQSAQKACLRARRLTQQLLTFSKGGAPIREATSLAELIEDTIAFALRGSNVSSSLDIPANLWPANVDPGQISQVLENLVINSVQAMPRGGQICISAANVTVDGDSDFGPARGKYIMLKVKDTGCGIDQDSLKKIFDPYFTTKKSGTGLGLATSYSIIKNHDGFIDVNSETDKGTEFTVYLPAMTGVVPETIVHPGQELEQGKGKILVLDDDEEILDVIREVLDLLGFEAVLVSDGSQVLDNYRQALDNNEPFDLVVMDLTVPGGMGGMETMQRLLKLDPDVRAVVSSGYSQDPVMANYKAHGFAGVLGKPYTINELSSMLNKILK
ncbi:MAG: PAS domain S-box protein [Desulfonatronovibrio sp.]